MKKLFSALLVMVFLGSCKQDDYSSESIQIMKNKYGIIEKAIIFKSVEDSSYIELNFYQNGEIEFLTEYQNGLKNGKNFHWRENGRLALESYTTNGEYDFVIREVGENGRTRFEGERIDTKFEGITNSFYKSGAIEMSWIRTGNKDFGRMIKYYENGMINELGEMTDSGYVLFVKWDVNGNKTFEKDDMLTPSNTP